MRADRIPTGEVARGWVDRVLDHLVEAKQVRGAARPGRRLGWVSALHVLTEQLLGLQDEPSFQTGEPHHTEYAYIAAAVVYLESLGLLDVERACGPRSSQSNQVERITVVY